MSGKPVGAGTFVRVVGCQGSLQLLTAISVLQQRPPPARSRDYLVIFSLACSDTQREGFLEVIRTLAMRLHHWAGILEITAGEIDRAHAGWCAGKPEAIRPIRDAIGVESADEVYSARDWQAGNVVLLSTFPSARRICYGDSIGVYFSPGYFARDDGWIRRGARRVSAAMRARIRGAAAAPTAFDEGYFLLPDAFGANPIPALHSVNPQALRGIFANLRQAVPTDLVARIRERIAGRQTLFLLGSNFSETGALAREVEPDAYRAFLEAERLCGSDIVLLVKPHPRDDSDKPQRVADALRDLFADTIILDDPFLFYFPFEPFLLALAADTEHQAKQTTIACFSSSCLPLSLLLALPVKLGFGQSIVQARFTAPHMRARLRHEADLQRLLAPA